MQAPKKGDVLIEHTKYIDWYHVILDSPKQSGHVDVTLIGLHKGVNLPPDTHCGALDLSRWNMTNIKTGEWLITLKEPVEE